MASTYWVALGSNVATQRLGTSLEACQWALEQLRAITQISLRALSSWYATAPIPAADQPDFINGVVMLDSTLPPHALLARLHDIEARAGRVRAEPNAARVLDLDLLAADRLVISDPTLTLPHPRLAERAFVLYPLCDVAPEWRHPVLGQTALALREALPPQRIERLPSTPEDLLFRARALR